jgi:hypothetical protein
MYSTEMAIHAAIIDKPKALRPTNFPDVQKLEALDSILTAIERWFEIFFEVPLNDWIGITFGDFVQFSHCLMLLIQLLAINEPGWDTEEVKKRADPVDILERVAKRLDRLPSTLGLIESVGTRRGGFIFQSARFIRGMQAFIVAELALKTVPANGPSNDHQNTADVAGDSSFPDDINMSFMDDPWLTDMFMSSWEFSF